MWYIENAFMHILRFLLFCWIILGLTEKMCSTVYKIFIEFRECHSWAGTAARPRELETSHEPVRRTQNTHTQTDTLTRYPPSSFLSHQVSLLHRRLNENSLNSADTILRINISLWFASTHSMWLALLRRYKLRASCLCAMWLKQWQMTVWRSNGKTVVAMSSGPCGLFSNLMLDCLELSFEVNKPNAICAARCVA